MPYFYDPDRDSYDYIDSRLSGTVVRNTEDGELVYVRRVAAFRNGETAEVVELATGTGRRVDVKRLDAEPLKTLGYAMVHGEVTAFIARKPTRRYRQGSSWASLGLLPRNTAFVDGGHWQSYQCLLMPDKQRYPKRAEAFCMVQDEFKAVPLTRNVAVDENMRALYKGSNTPVGKFNDDNGMLNLFESYRYLAEVMEKEIGGVVING